MGKSNNCKTAAAAIFARLKGRNACCTGYARTKNNPERSSESKGIHEEKENIYVEKIMV